MERVKDIMTTEVVSVSAETPVYAAMRILVDSKITGLPVVGDDMVLEGVVSERDMLEHLYGGAGEDGTVGDIMTREVVTYSPEDDLMDLCEALVMHRFRRVPIVSDGKLVGLVSRGDIIQHLLRQRQEH